MKNIRDLVTGLVFMIVAVAYYLLAINIPDAGVSRVGPGFVPQIIAGLMFVLSLPLVVKGVRDVAHPGTARRATSDDGTADSTLPSDSGDAALTATERRASRWSVLISSLLLVVYVILIPVFGFVLSTLGYLFLQFNAGAPVGKRSLRAQFFYLLSAVVLALFINWAFRDGFLVLLPEGIWG